MANLALESLRLVVRDLDEAELRWALIGGLAVSARAEPRFTRDVDVCVVVPDDATAEQSVLRLGRRGYGVLSIVEHQQAGRLATVRLAAPGVAGVVVDLLFASSGIEPEIVQDAEPLELLPGLVVRVARVPHLVVLKLLARDDRTRPQDGADLLALRGVLTHTDQADIRRLAQLVCARGFHRERDLVALADDYLAG